MITAGPFIILDKRPYREAGLLLRGISPDYGRISFILHGGQSFSKSSPEADIFREVEIEFEDLMFYFAIGLVTLMLAEWYLQSRKSL